MALSPITEFFNKGVVTARHPSLLVPGELQQADDCVYRRKSPAIHRAPGRTVYNSTTLKTVPGGATPAGIKGLAQLSFDSNTDQITAWASGNGTSSYLWTSPFSALTGSFNLLTGTGQVVANSHSNTTIDGAPAGSFTYMFIGAAIHGSNIPPGTVVTAIGSDTSITISNAASSTASGITYTFDAGIPYTLNDNSDDMMDIVQWQDSYFILTRNNPIARIQWRQPRGAAATETLILRRAGMNPVTQFDTTNIAIQAGAGWSSVLGNGYYWFLLTEICDFGDPIGEIESGYIANNGQAQVVQITTFSNQFVRVTFPSLRNDGSNGTNRTTHWGIYMSFIGPSAAAYDDATTMPSAATFRRVSKVDVDAGATFDIKFTNTSQTKLPTTSAAYAGLTQFTNPSNMFTQGSGFARGSSGGGATAANALAGFSFPTGSPFSGYAVTGIEVIVNCRSALGGSAGYFVSLDNNSTKVSNSHFGIAQGAFFVSQSWGGQFDTWGQSWTISDTGNLRVIVQKSYSNSTQILDIDYIQVKIYYSGASADPGSITFNGPYYQVVTYRSQIGTTVNDPANYIIPSASTGDIFQGSFVINDIANPNQIRYSLALQPESFPKPYILKFNSKTKDIVTCIRTVGQILLVGMRDSIKRIMYLPTEIDVDFHKGKAHEDVVTDHGIVGPLAAALVDMTGSGVVLAYVGYNGLYYTDGVTDHALNLDFRLSDFVKLSAISSCVLRVYPTEKWIVLYYCPLGATHSKNTKALVFSYASDKIKEGGYLPMTGPITVSGQSAFSSKLAGVSYLITGHESDGKVYIEDNGYTIPTGYQVSDLTNTLQNVKIVPIIRTRKIYASGYSRDTRTQKFYLLHDSHGSTYAVSNVTVTKGSTTLVSSAAFGSITIGMRVRGTGIRPDTIVTVVTDTSHITISKAPTISGTQNLTFDDGTLEVTLRGSGIGEVVKEYQQFYPSTLTGDLLVTQHDSMKQGIEFRIEKVLLPDKTTIVDLGVNMILHSWSLLAADGGSEQNRATS